MEHTENKLKTFLTSPKGLTVIVVCIAILLAIYLLLSTRIPSGGQNLKAPEILSTPTMTQTSQYTTNPSQITSTLSFSKNTDTSINIMLDTAGKDVSGVQLAIAYSPTTLSGVSITSGDFFDSPLILQNAVDATHGVIYYTISIQPNSAQQYGKGTIAVLHYMSVVKGTSTSLSFLPQTKITTIGVNDSVLRKSTPMQFP